MTVLVDDLSPSRLHFGCRVLVYLAVCFVYFVPVFLLALLIAAERPLISKIHSHDDGKT